MAANRSEEEWQRLVGGWRASGLPCRAFAAQLGVHPKTLTWWAWRLGSRAASRGRPSPGFVEVVVDGLGVGSPPPFIVEVGGVRVRVLAGFDAGELRRLVGALC